MTVIFGTLKDVGGQLAQGTVTVSSLVTRPAHGAAATVITKERHVLPLRNGEFVSPDLDPGPVLVEATTGGAFESWQVTLPEDGRHDLATLIETHVEYAPSVVGRVEAAAADANRAAQAAGQSATRAGEAEARVVQVVASAADVVRGELQAQVDGATQARVDAVSARVAAETARDDAVAARDGAVAARTTAEGARDGAVAANTSATDAATKAKASETAAGASAAAAKASETAAAGDATAAAGARDGAVSAADDAQGSATAAASDADRAESAAAGVDQVLSDAAGVLRGEVADDVAAAQAARTGAEDAAGRAATEAGAAAQIAAQEKIAELVGNAPSHLDTIYELAAAFKERGDAVEAIQAALANRVVGNHSSVISSTAPGAGTPSDQITFVVEGA